MDTFNIKNIKTKMLIKYPFFGSVVVNLKYKETRGISTAGTDGKTIYYNPDYLSKLTENQQVFVLAHEICHVAFNHILRSEGKNPRIWNIATDAIINQMLIKDGLEKVANLIDMEEAIYYDAETLYNKMVKEDQQKEENASKSTNDSNDSQQGSSNDNSQNSQDSQEGNNQSGNNNESNQKQDQQRSRTENNASEQQERAESEKRDVGHDTHTMWEEAVKREKEGKEYEDGAEQIEETQKEIGEIGERAAFEKNKNIRSEDLKRFRDGLRQQSNETVWSRTPPTGDIGTNKPVLDWRLLLRNAIARNYEWRIDDIFDDNVLGSTLEPVPSSQTEILLDTSGSINQELLKNFLRECKNVLKVSSVKVGCFDTRFYGFTEIRTSKDIENLQYVGGGGTDFEVAVNAFTRRVENKIIFTDGEARMPVTPINAIWIVFGDARINPPGAYRVIYITPEQLRRLSFDMDSQNDDSIIRSI